MKFKNNNKMIIIRINFKKKVSIIIWNQIVKNYKRISIKKIHHY